MREAAPPAANEPQTQAPGPAATRPPESAAAQPPVDTQSVTPWWNTTDKKENGFHLDLSTPEATVRSFTKAIVSGNAESVMACFLPGGADFQDMQEILNADPDDPEQRSEQEMKLWLQSLDPDVEMPIVETKEDGGAMQVTWQVTFKKDVTALGQTFRAGDTWLIDNL